MVDANGVEIRLKDRVLFFDSFSERKNLHTGYVDSFVQNHLVAVPCGNNTWYIPHNELFVLAHMDGGEKHERQKWR